MKKTLFIIAAFVMTFSGLSGFTQESGKGLCKAYFPLEKGTELTYENYNAKGKLQSSEILTVKDLIETAESIAIKVNLKSFDKKGEEASQSEFEYSCENGVFRMSLESIMDQGMMEAYKDMEVTMTQTELELPSDMTIGESLPDADIKMTISSSGTQIMTIDMKITDRKVEAKESITTTGGTFECYKLSQTTNMKMMFMNKTMKSVDWIAENIGSVRSESYSTSGKLESYRVLTNIKR